MKKVLLKKIITTALGVSLVFSSLLINTFAINDVMWVDKSFTVVQNQSYWNDTEKFDDVAPVTRKEAAAIVAKVIGAVYPSGSVSYKDVSDATPYASKIYAVSGLNIFSGADGCFNPDNYLTREELACVVVRTYNAINQTPLVSEIKEDRLEDFSDISDWAKESVFGAMSLKAMTAKKSVFLPKKYATRAEALNAISTVAGVAMFDYVETKEIVVADNPQTPQKPNTEDTGFNYSKLTFAGDNVLNGRDMGTVAETDSYDVSKSPVYQSVTINNQRGTSGAYIKARYTKDEAVELYVARTTKKPEVDPSVPYDSSTYIRIEDPDGNLVGFYDFTTMADGKKVVKLNPSVKKDGIWTFRFIGGRTGDTVEFGFNGKSSWGIAGMCSFRLTKDTLKEGYVYIPRTVTKLYAFSNEAGTISLADSKGKKVGSPETNSSNWYKYVTKIDDATPETAYKIKFSSSSTDIVAIDYAPSLISPTADMAMDLKGGWVEAKNGVLCQGPLQARCMNLAYDIVTKRDLEVKLDEIPPLPEKIDYPMAEAQMFGKYAPLSSLQYTLASQILDENDPHLGLVDVATYQGKGTLTDYQAGEFCGINLSPLDAMSGALRIPAQLNYYYGNENLRNRCELYLLSGLIPLSEDMYIRENSLTSGTTGGTHLGFYFKYNTHAYQLLKDFLPKEDLEVIEETFIAFSDTQQNYRGYVTNQLLHANEGLLCMYQATGLERYHEAWKRQITTVMNPVKGWEHLAFRKEVGFFVESYGCDGNYSWLNEYFFNNMYREYRELETADEKIVAQMAETIDRYLEFESFAWLTDPLDLASGEFPMASSFTSRTDSNFGYTNGYPHIERNMDIHPYSRKRQELIGYDHANSPYPASIFPHIMNSEDWAMQQIKEFYPKYDNHFQGQTVMGWTNDLYNVFYEAYYGKGADLDTSGVILPCEQEDQVWSDRPGFIAYKSNGIYGYTFYDFNTAWAIPNPSYMGGGPTVLFAENTGGTLVSKKSPSYGNPQNIDTPEEIASTCIYGTDSAGTFIYSGKERTSIKWIKENEIWELSGTIPNTSQTVTWRYEMIDTGVRIIVSLSNPKGGNYWVNLPLYAGDNKHDILSYKEGELKIGKGNEAMTYKWDSGESKLSDIIKTVKNLRIKFPKNGVVTIDLSCRQ